MRSWTSYGLAAACLIMLIKSIGVPIPIPGDVILLAMAARAAEGKVLLWLAFLSLLVVVTVGGTVQYWLARGPARNLVLRYGGRLGITPERGWHGSRRACSAAAPGHRRGGAHTWRDAPPRFRAAAWPCAAARFVPGPGAGQRPRPGLAFRARFRRRRLAGGDRAAVADRAGTRA